MPKEKRSGGQGNNTRAQSFEDIQYSEHHALVLSGRVPGFKRDDVKLLPSAETKAKVYGVYEGFRYDYQKYIHTCIYNMTY